MRAKGFSFLRSEIVKVFILVPALRAGTHTGI